MTKFIKESKYALNARAVLAAPNKTTKKKQIIFLKICHSTNLLRIPGSYSSLNNNNNNNSFSWFLLLPMMKAIISPTLT